MAVSTVQIKRLPQHYLIGIMLQEDEVEYSRHAKQLTAQ
jgi:hypothetical protein